MDLAFQQQLFRWTLPMVFFGEGSAVRLDETVGMLWQMVLHMSPKLLPCFRVFSPFWPIQDRVFECLPLGFLWRLLLVQLGARS